MIRQRFRQAGPRGIQWVGPILVALLVAAAGWWTLTAVADLQDSATEGQAARELLAQDVDALRDQVLELGEEPVAPPADDTVERVQGERGIPGRPGLSCVEEYGFQLCRGPKGDPGEDSTVPGPSCAQEFGFLACRGDPGESIKGDPGEDSTVPGPAGRGVASSSIVDGQLVISYTDGTSETVGQVVGQDGREGADGPTCPDGIEPVERWIIAVPERFTFPPPQNVWDVATLERVLICLAP